MPKARERIVYCDCLDCKDQPDFETGLSLSSANEAVARQLPAPKCLWICLTGVVQPSDDGRTLDGALTSVEAITAPHINKLCKEGGTGFLSFRQNVSSTPENEIAQLLGVPEVIQGGAVTSTVQKRFKKMQAVYDSNVPAVHAMAPGAGLTPASLLPAGSECVLGEVHLQLPKPEEVAGQLLQHLGLAKEPAPHPDLDVLLLHVDGPTAYGPPADSTSPQQHRFDGACATLEWLDQVLKGVATVQAVRETVLVVVVLTPSGQVVAPGLLEPSGAKLQPGKVIRSVDEVEDSADAPPAVIRPLQSFETEEGRLVAVQLDAPALVIRRLAGVIRRDKAEVASFKEVCEKGVHGCILADRLLCEVAYKVAKAAKYGA